MTDAEWTPEQEAVLADEARLLLVRAGPGSGKTRVFVELLKRQLDAWGSRGGGVAALSFTNAAHDEIVARLGGHVGYPHFTGTLDAFFFRFVVAPFAHLLRIPPGHLRLIPSPLNREILRPAVAFPMKGGGEYDVPVLHLDPLAGTEQAPTFQRLRRFGEGYEAVEAAMEKDVLRAKAAEWRASGRITHGDCHYLAACVLRGEHGAAVRTLLVKRFPVLLVDELQDTGHFLGRALLPVLAEASVRAVLVGDEDQRIFGFAGADPKLFRNVEGLPGCKPFALTVTHRCDRAVARVVTTLSRSGRHVVPKEGAVEGIAVLRAHDGEADSAFPTVLKEALLECEEHGCTTVAILARTRDEVRAIAGLAPSTTAKLGSRGARSMDRAERQLLEGRGDVAAKIAEALLGHTLFELASPTRSELLAAEIDPVEFGRRARSIVLKSLTAAVGKTWGEWSDFAKRLLDHAASEMGGRNYKHRLGGMFKRRHGDAADALRQSASGDGAHHPTMKLETITIHKSKGREFDGVCVYWPQPRGDDECPSESWWAAAEHSEEREVAFVAASRARRVLVTCVHRTTYEAMATKRPEYVAAFTVKVVPPPPTLAATQPKKRRRKRT